jgi:hypothetical protein
MGLAMTWNGHALGLSSTSIISASVLPLAGGGWLETEETSLCPRKEAFHFNKLLAGRRKQGIECFAHRLPSATCMLKFGTIPTSANDGGHSADSAGMESSSAITATIQAEPIVAVLSGWLQDCMR